MMKESAALKKIRVEKMADHFAQIMGLLNLDLKDPSLINTPSRVAKMLVNETCSSLFTAPPRLTTFPNKGNDQMVIVQEISINSLCEHHFQPFIGSCHIAYFPKDHLLGLSKFNRTAQYFASKPQLQERLTNEIADYLTLHLETEDIAVIIKAKHFCCAIRGAKDANSKTISSYMGGKFREPSVRGELLTLLQLK